MEHKNSSNIRWLVLLGSILAMISLGTIYTWSLFNAPLAKLHGWAVEQVVLCFSIATLSLAIGAFFAANLQEKFGAKKVIIVCGLAMGAGLMAASEVSSLWELYLTAGVLAGFSNGVGYMLVLTNCIKWFPKESGLISGITIGSYGIGSLVFKYINEALLEDYGIQETFFYWGGIALIMIVIGALLVKDAPEAKSTQVGHGNYEEFSRKELFYTPQAYLLFFSFLASCLGGLYVIGAAKDIAMQMGGLNATVAGSTVVIIALLNTLGRFVLGALSDRMERTKVCAIAFWIIIISASILLFKQLDYVWLLLSIGGIAFAFGGTLSVFPAIVGEYFGVNNSGKNYGVIYQGFGIGGFSGGAIANVMGSLHATFYVVLALSVLASFVMMFIQPPHKK